MSSSTKIAQLLGISTSLIASGGIATLSLFDIPEIQSQPASRSLPMVRWLFSRGSHIFPTAAAISSASFAFLAYNALPALIQRRGVASAIIHLFKLTSNSFQVNGYLAAAVLTISIGPFTTFAMVPTNFRLIEINEQLGGSRSAKTARESEKLAGRARTVEESVGGEGQPNQFTDLSVPQTQTARQASGSQEREVKELLGRFGVLNSVRAVLIGAGGVVGTLAALS